MRRCPNGLTTKARGYKRVWPLHTFPPHDHLFQSKVIEIVRGPHICEHVFCTTNVYIPWSSFLHFYQSGQRPIGGRFYQIHATGLGTRRKEWGPVVSATSWNTRFPWSSISAPNAAIFAGGTMAETDFLVLTNLRTPFRMDSHSGMVTLDAF